MQIKLLNKKKDKVSIFNTDKDKTYVISLSSWPPLFPPWYILNGIYYIYVLYVVILVLIIKLNIILGIIYSIIYFCFIYKYGNLIAIWTHLKSGWTFAEPNLPEVQEFIKKYKFEKYVK